MEIILKFADDDRKDLARLAIDSVDTALALMDFRDKLCQIEAHYDYPEDAAKRVPAEDIRALRAYFFELFSETINRLE